MSSKFVMVCKNCKFLSGPYNGVDTWFSCSCGENCFLSSRDIRSGKWRKFNRSTIPKTWLMCDHPTVVQVLEAHILRDIRSRDYDLSDNDDEDDDLTVEDFDPERIANILEDEYDSDEEEDSISNDTHDDSADSSSMESDEYDDDDDSADASSVEDDVYDDDDEDEVYDNRTMEEIDRDYEERYNRKRNQQ